MPELVQMNVSVREDLPALVETLAAETETAKYRVIETAVDLYAELRRLVADPDLILDPLREMMDRHEAIAAKATQPDVGALYLRLARLMPYELAEGKVQEARRANGDPALIVADEWIFAENNDGELMALRLDGSQSGHIESGQIVVLAEHSTEVAKVAALN